MRMTHERFEALAEAYGGDVSRWPEAERDAAALVMAQAPEAALRILGQAEALDAALDAWRPQPASPALYEAVLAAAPPPRRRSSLLGWLFPAGLGAGLAAACAAGVITGVQLSALYQAPAEAEAVATALKGYDVVDGAGEETLG